MNFPECAECGARLIPESVHCPRCGVPADHPLPTEVRCECGFLLSKLTEEAIEIKCRRCKRLVYVPIENLPERFEENKRKMEEYRSKVASYHMHRQAESRGQYCSGCGQYKPNVVYGKCLDCRTESIKVQYKSRSR